MFRLDKESGKFYQYKVATSKDNTFAANIIKAIIIYEPGILLIGTGFWPAGSGDGLKLFNTQTGEFTDFPKSGHLRKSNAAIIHSITKDASDNFWIGTDGQGIWQLFQDHRILKTHHLQYNPFDPLSLGDNRISIIYEDRAGNIWSGTREAGISKLSPRKNQFSKFYRIEGQKFTLSHNSIACFGEDSQGNLWVGTDGGGLNKMNLSTGEIQHYHHNPNDPFSLPHDVVSAFLEDKSGALWIGTEGGLNRLEKNSERFIHYRHNPNDAFSLSDNGIFNIYEDQQGTLWVGTRKGGLNRFNRQTGQFTSFKHDPSDSTSISSNAVMKLLEDREGNFWVCTFNSGLNKFDPKSGTFIHYRYHRADPSSISHNSVETILESADGTLWVGTWGGLNRFDAGAGKFYHYTQNDGLPDNIIYGILEDGQGNLWLSTPRGLSKFNPGTETFRNYDENDGLHDNAFTEFAYYKSPSTGMMFFGGGRGFTAFHPDSLADNLHVPPVILTGFNIFNEPAHLSASISFTEEIRLSYQENFFTIKFAALDYTHPGKNQYAYKLKGIDPDWVKSGNRNYASYTNVPPGEYLFHVKGSNNDGIWNEKGITLRIIVDPPPWKTGWAYTLYAGLIIAILYGLRRFEINRQRLRQELEMEHIQAEKLAELDRMKSRFFANISHEFRTPMTLIVGPLERLISQTADVKLHDTYLLMQRNGRRLLRLINQLLDLSKLEAGKMALQAAPYDLEEVLKPLVMAFESLAGLREIDLRFVPPQEPVTSFLDRDKFEKIMTNLLSNAFKFTGEGGRVEVAVDIPPCPSFDKLRTGSSKGGAQPVSPFEGGLRGMLEITVKDSGIGIPADHLAHIFERFYQADTSHTRENESSGIGLALTRELVELHHGVITVESEQDKGSTFTVRLPLGKKHLKPEEIVEPRAQPSEGYQEVETLRGIAESTFLANAGIVPKPSEGSGAEIVLIVEDNPDMSGYIRERLSWIYRIQEAANGAEGFRQALKHNPVLIVSDVMMPEMDGFELCAKLKTDERTSHIPVILLTAKAGDENKLEGLETGADDYLTKPFNPRELQVRAKNLIEQRERLRQRFREQVLIQPSEITATSMDARFLERAIAFVEAHLDDSDLNVKQFSMEMALSRSQLNRKLKALTGQSANEFIRCLRLKRAAQLLQQRAGNVSEIAYEVGFSNPAYFAECFRKQFGVRPSEFAEEKKGNPS